MSVNIPPVVIATKGYSLEVFIRGWLVEPDDCPCENCGHIIHAGEDAWKFHGDMPWAAYCCRRCVEKAMS